MPDTRKLPDDAVTQAPEGVDLKVGDTVTFINDYGVIWLGKKVLGFCIPDPDWRPWATVYIDSEPFWFANKAECLVKESGRDFMPEMKWIYSAKPLPDGTHRERAAVVEYVREWHKETPDKAKLAKLKKQIMGKTPTKG